MKKTIALTMLLFSAAFVMAQTPDSIPHVNPAPGKWSLDTNSKSKTIIEIITNLNSTPQTFQKFIAHLIELSKYYKKVKLSISIEAFEKKTEYIRDGLSWNRWKENFETLMKLDINNVHIIILTTTNILSISSLHKLIVYVGHQMKTWRTSVDLSQNLVVFPQANSPLLLTADFSKYIDKAIQKIQHYAKYADSSTDSQKLYSKSWIEYIHSLELIKVSIQSHVLIESEKKLIREFYNQFDLRRGKNIYRVFPEYKNFLKKCGVYQRPRTLRTIFKDLGKYFI